MEVKVPLVLKVIEDHRGLRDLQELRGLLAHKELVDHRVPKDHKGQQGT